MISLRTRLMILITTILMTSTVLLASNTIYSYTGGYYTAGGYGCIWPSCPYDDTMQVSGIFIAPTLGPNRPWGSVAPLFYDFKDGRQEFFTGDGSSLLLFDVMTNSSGLPSFWEIVVIGGPEWWGYGTIETHVAPASGPFFDQGIQYGNTGATYYGNVYGFRGTWSAAPVPEPATLLMLGSAITLLGHRIKQGWLR